MTQPSMPMYSLNSISSYELSNWLYCFLDDAMHGMFIRMSTSWLSSLEVHHQYSLPVSSLYCQQVMGIHSMGVDKDHNLNVAKWKDTFSGTGRS